MQTIFSAGPNHKAGGPQCIVNTEVGVLGDQSPCTGVKSLFFRITTNVLERAINAVGQSAPEVDDPVRWFSVCAFGIRQGKRTGLDDYVAVVK